MNKPTRSLAAATAVALATLANPAHAVSFSAFAFDSQVSTSGVSGGDVRLDAVSFGGATYSGAQLTTVSAANIVLDDALDAVNGGGNLAAGRGINAAADAWAPEGPATVTPTSADLLGALANKNLTSIVVTRENPGSAVLDVSFAAPTDTFLFYERGFNSDLQVQALNANQQVIGSYTILRANYANTGILISTDNGAFQLASQGLGSIGLRTDEAVSTLRLSSYRSDVLNYNGPDFKVLGVSPVPEPESWALMLAGLGALGFLARRRSRR